MKAFLKHCIDVYRDVEIFIRDMEISLWRFYKTWSFI